MIKGTKQQHENKILEFRKEFFLEFGFLLDIEIPDSPKKVLINTAYDTLEKLENLINNFTRLKDKTIVNKCRRRDLVNLRTIFSMLAYDIGFTYSQIGAYLSQKHETVIYNVKAGYDFLEYNEDFRKQYITISTIVDPTIYPHARIIDISDETSDNGRPIGSSRLYKRKYKVTKPVARQRGGFTKSQREEFIRSKQQADDKRDNPPRGSITLI